MSQFSVHVGLDVHKNSIHVAFSNTKTGEIASLGGVTNDVTRLLAKLEPLGSPGQIQVCYEAGPTGYGLYRRLRDLGYECHVVAPAKNRRPLLRVRYPRGEQLHCGIDPRTSV